MDDSSTVRIQLPLTGDQTAADARAAAFIVIRGEELGRRYPLGPGDQVVGRRADVAISIFDRSLSRRHCAVELRGTSHGPAYVLRDLGSTNGTHVNGQPITERELEDGDKVTIGDVVLKFVFLDTVEEHFHHAVADLIRSDRQTGLLNVTAFYLELDRALYQARESHTTLGLIMMDVDGLKAVNDQHGHQLGSTVILTMAEYIQEAIDSVQGVAAVYGGDEFIALVPEGGEAAAVALGDAVRCRIVETEFAGEHGPPAKVSLSVGVAEFPRDGTVREVLVRRADLALYAAKNDGKNCVRVFTGDMEREA